MSLLTPGDLNPFDAFKLIKLIYSIARKAKVHRETCTEFASYLNVINNLLAPVQASEQVLQLPAVQDALAMLQRTLVKAFLLIQKCERTSTLTALLKHVPRQLKELEGEIQKILSLLNLANLHVNLHITTNGSSEELNKAASSSYPEVFNPSLGETHSFQETYAKHDELPARSLSEPSTSGQSLATSHSLSAKSLSITWGKDERYWKWVARTGSRFSEVAYLVDVYWLEVQGHLNTCTLRPGRYTLSWRLQVACLEDDDKPSGWESQPVVFKFSTSDGRQHTERSAFLIGLSNQVSTKGDETLAQHSSNGHKAADGWMEYDVGEFTVNKQQDPIELTFSMNEVNGSWKRGLFLDSVIITPCADPDSEIISADEGSSSTFIQDVADLPDMISSPFHCHELKLMIDPYWFACDVCEATDHGVGYHCHQCRYSVHPQCCMSDYHFATLLDLTDSEPSHWHWGTLLELNKHRIEEKSSRPKSVMFAGHPHRLKLAQNPYPSFICNAINCDGQGWVYKGWDGWIYHCQECKFDIHPECRF